MKDPVLTGAIQTWAVGETIAALHEGVIPRAYVKLHENLVGAWHHTDEVRRALEIGYALLHGPHPAIAGYPEGGDPHWIGVDVFDLQAEHMDRHGHSMPREELIKRLIGRCADLAVVLMSASMFKQEGRSVAPVDLDYDAKRVASLAAPTAKGMLAVITLAKGEKAWTPGIGYTSYNGPGTASYLITDSGVEADFIREFD